MKALELIFFLFVLGIAITALYGWDQANNDLIRFRQMETRDWMCGQYVKNATLLNGFYNRDSRFYCVWVADRTEADINRTVFHEETHHLIGNDPMHYCIRYNKTICR